MSVASFSRVVRSALSVSDADATAELLCAGWRCEAGFWHAPVGYTRAYCFVRPVYVALAILRAEIAGEITVASDRHTAFARVNLAIVTISSPPCVSCSGVGAHLCEDCGASGEREYAEVCGYCTGEGEHECAECEGVQILDDDAVAVLLHGERIVGAKRAKAARRLETAQAEHDRLVADEMAIMMRRVCAQGEAA